MTKYFLLLAACLLAVPSYAEFTTNMGVANKYMFRGLKQSDQDIVVHGGLDYTSPWGVYAGAWGYTGSIEDFDTSEVNAYGGFAFSLWDVSIGIGIIHYERGADAIIGPVTTETDGEGNVTTKDPCAVKLNCIYGVSTTEYNVNLAWNAYRISTYQDEDKNQYHEVAANYDIWGSNVHFFVGRYDPVGW